MSQNLSNAILVTYINTTDFLQNPNSKETFKYFQINHFNSHLIELLNNFKKNIITSKHQIINIDTYNENFISNFLHKGSFTMITFKLVSLKI